MWTMLTTHCVMFFCHIVVFVSLLVRNLEGITDVASAMYQKKDTYVRISHGFDDEIMSLKEVREKE